MSNYELRDANIGSLVKYGFGLFALMVVALIAMWLLFSYLAGGPPPVPAPPPLAEGRELPPAPRLQVAPKTELDELRSIEDASLNSYGWVDREGGVVRIPIDRAMELLADSGLPARDAGQRTQ